MVSLKEKKRALARHYLHQWTAVENTPWRDLADELGLKQHVTLVNVYSGKTAVGDALEQALAEKLFGGSIDKLREEAGLIWDRSKGMRHTALAKAMRDTRYSDETIEFAVSLDARWPADVDRSASDWRRELDEFESAVADRR